MLWCLFYILGLAAVFYWGRDKCYTNNNERGYAKMKIKPLISNRKIKKKIKKIAKQISRDYAGKELLIVFILKGSVFYACELAKQITVPVEIDFMKVSSYGSGTKSKGSIDIEQDLSEGIENKHVLIVEDIIDTGITLSTLVPILKERRPASIAITTLLDKPSRRKAEVDVDYVGFIIDDYFVVGYGLDYDQRFRNLDYVGVVELD